MKCVWNIHETKIIFYARKTNSILLNYNIRDFSFSSTDCTERTGVVLDSKMHFHCPVYCAFTQALRTLGVVVISHVLQLYLV
jgi:hypothetical protein